VFRRNPVYQREIGTDARASRAFLLIIAFNCVLAGVTFAMFYSAFNGAGNMGAVDYSGLTRLYTFMAYVEIGMVMLIIPAATAGAITGERERKTLDIMLVGNRHARTIVFGKFMSNIRIVLIGMISSIPVLSMVFVYGGIRVMNLAQLLGIILVAGIYLGSIGIFCSSISKKTTSAIMIAYSVFVGLILVTVGLGYFFARIDMNKSASIGSAMLYLNPIAPVTYLISDQLETASGLEKIIFYGTSGAVSGEVPANWLFYSVIVQLTISVILLNVSVLILNPVKFNSLRRFYRLYVNRKKIEKN